MLKQINLKEDALNWAPAALKLLSKLESTYGSLAVYQYCEQIDNAKKFKQKRQWWKDNFLQGRDFVVFKGQTIALEPTDLDNVATMCIKLLVKVKPKLKDLKREAEVTLKLQSSAVRKTENWSHDEEDSLPALIEDYMDPYSDKDFDYGVSRNAQENLEVTAENLSKSFRI